MFWAAASTKEFFDSEMNPNMDDRNRANQWFDLALKFDEDAFKQCNFDVLANYASITTVRLYKSPMTARVVSVNPYYNHFDRRTKYLFHWMISNAST